MKLVFAVINSDESAKAAKALAGAGFIVTRLSSSGGFLRKKSMTFMICTEDGKVDEIIGILKTQCHKRKQIVPSSAHGVGTYNAVPMQVSVSGAAIFVTDAERFEKV